MAVRQQQRRGTAAQWTSANPILSPGEIGFEIDTNKFKIGDGTTRWASLIYFTADAAGAIEDLIGGAPGLLDTLNELAAAVGDDANFFSTVTTNIATAKSEAISTASSDATTKANAAKTAAEATASADATTKANAAKTAAEATASADATTKAANAKSEAISVSAADATAKANAAEAAAIAAAATDATSKVATETTARNTALDLKAPKDSPTFTGTPLAPTASVGTDTTQVATTAFVKAAIEDIASLNLVLDGGGV